jgi:hypothetical protein
MHRFLPVLLFCTTCGVLAAGAANREANALLSAMPVRFEPVGGDHHRFVARGTHFRTQLSATEASVITADGRVDVRFEGARPVALEGRDALSATTNILRGNDRSAWRMGIPNYSRLVARGVYPGVDIVYYGSQGELEYDLVVHPGADLRQIRLRVNGTAARIDGAGNLVAGAVHKAPVTYQTSANGARSALRSKFRRNADGTFGFDVARYDRTRDLVIDPQLVMSAYQSGNYQDVAVAVGHDAAGFVYVGGTSFSTDFPTTTDTAFQPDTKGSTDLFVMKIDPSKPVGAQVVYSTYAGGTGADVMGDMVVDSQGTVYITGNTASIDFPLGNAAQSALSGTFDAFVLWLNLNQTGASAMYYGSYLGGSGVDGGTGITVDPQGRIAIVGTTQSKDLAAGSGYQSSLLGTQDAFVALIDPRQSGAGTLVYCTYLGGTNWDSGSGIAAAPDGTLWVTGSTLSGDYPLTYNSVQPYYGFGGDGFVSQIDPNQAGGSSLPYSSYLGGSDMDGGNAIAVDPAGRILVTGFTLSTDMVVTGNAAQRRLATADADFPSANAFVFVMKRSDAVSPAAQLIYSSYLGGTGSDEGYAIEGDAAGNVYVAGMTKSYDFPVTKDALQTKLLGGPSGFLTKVNPSRGAWEYSSLVTSIGHQIVYGMDLDRNGVVYLAGFSSGPLLEAMGGIPRATESGNSDGFVLGLSPCTLAASPTALLLPPGGGQATITVAAGTGCSWAAGSGAGWIGITPTAGVGNGQVTVMAGPNTTGAQRIDFVKVAGTQVTIGQNAQ